MKKLSVTLEDGDSDQEGDPEHILDEWLGELKNLSGVSVFILCLCQKGNFLPSLYIEFLILQLLKDCIK